LKIFHLIAVILIGLYINSFSAIASEKVESKHLLSAIIIKLSHFIQWPEIKDKKNNIRLCLYGDSSYSEILNQSVEHHPFIRYPVKTYQDIVEVNGRCDILYMAPSKSTTLIKDFSYLKTYPILTVSDIPGFEANGGIIEISVKNNKLSIAINIDSAKKAGLKIDTPLLNIASGARKDKKS